MAVYRTLQPALTLAGRDTRVPDGSKPRLAAHKAAVATVKALVLNAPAATQVTTTAATTIAEDEAQPPGSAAPATTGDGGVWPVAHVCVVGALQRMTVMVPDKAASRAPVLASIVALLGVLARYLDLTTRTLHICFYCLSSHKLWCLAAVMRQCRRRRRRPLRQRWAPGLPPSRWRGTCRSSPSSLAPTR